MLGGQCYGGPMLWGALWLLKDPMLRRGSGCAAVTPGVALAPSIRGSQWPPLSPLLRHPILLAASAPAPPAPHYGVCAHRCWVFGGSGFSFSLSSVKSYRLLLLRPGNKILSKQACCAGCMADPSRCNSTGRQNPPIQQNRHCFMFWN